MTQGYLPSSITKLIIGKYDHALEPGSLSPSITELKAKYLSHKLQPDVLPPSITTLTLGSCLKKIQPHTLPSSLISLTIEATTFGDPDATPFVPGSLPDSLQTLILSDDFNQSLKAGILPMSLTVLHFGDRYNHPLPPGILPSSLKILKFIGLFNQSLAPGSLPSSLNTLELGNCFNLPLVRGSIPDSLTKLTFGNLFNHPIPDHVLPLSITSLKFGKYYRWSFTKGSLPSLLRSLTLGYIYSNILAPGSLPTTLDTLILNSTPFESLAPINGGGPLSDMLPSSLTKLSFCNSFNIPLYKGILPETLKWLRLGRVQFNRCTTMGDRLEELIIEDTLFTGFQGPQHNVPIKNLRLISNYPLSSLVNDMDLQSMSKVTNIYFKGSTTSNGNGNDYVPQLYYKLRKVDQQYCICIRVQGSKNIQYQTINTFEDD
ncbi:hypothetical protein SAMD00019534_028520 [Acytostelium subglobosum LB1]|uniref:hypothetical protein n=1 Tax=Acytostelium subglobosum LB1 TaxID=1410327 RepID=UPI000644D09A|nr:hypothetical protein SAMD00019534_028520 [Acytostelium subglobosum LB1]GAM19677.1 hypothetical protein SAMD00019534_028520 [Acytostelium subglobosum LB1]|eukprot:XP_012756439.1 hypothetical protein SAMD00019534_028520 [Acytostelium subglobosum LB1]